jgi:D-arginine dehydrogenase
VQSFDVLVVGGGIAGLSVASALARQVRVAVLEAEQQCGFHASGRSATMVHYALGDPLVRELTRASRPFFDAPPDGFADTTLGTPVPVLVHARAEESAALDEAFAAIAPFAPLERLDDVGVKRLCPVLQADLGFVDRGALRIDSHALLEGHRRSLRRSGGTLVTGAEAVSIDRRGSGWTVQTRASGTFAAPVLVNAAGAWADAVARLAGIEPLGLQPLRRTIITFDPPAGCDPTSWPFSKTVGEELYFAPEAGRVLASPMDEAPAEPCDAQPDEEAVALAAWRVEQRTTMKVHAVHSRWAGLRTFAPDRHPIVGFDPLTEGFFWLAGQGGFGLQTSPALGAAAAALITGSAWPLAGVGFADLSPVRFRS